MNQTQQLGGTRQSSPLEDEMSYPLTEDEYLLIKENLAIDKFTNWESFLLTTGITSLITCIIFCITGSFETHLHTGGQDIIKINAQQVIIVIIYSALAFGSILGFGLSLVSKRKSKNVIQRLDNKISVHLNKFKNE